MDKRTLEFRVGAMLVGVALIGTILAAMFGGLPSFRKSYTINVSFASAPGLSVGAPVRKSGIRIGEVSRIDLAPDGRVTAVLRIEDKYRLYDNETCRLHTSLLGDTWLEFEPAEPGSGDSRTAGRAAAPADKATGR